MADQIIAQGDASRNPICEQCCGQITRNPNDSRSRWLARRFCSVACRTAVSRKAPVDTLAERLAAKLAKTPGLGPNGDCWEWQGHRSKSGYGRIGIAGQGQGVTDLTHRVAYRLAKGEIPEGMEVCHRCDNPPCCNPAHLEIGTHRDNMSDMATKGRANGHFSRPRQ